MLVCLKPKVGGWGVLANPTFDAESNLSETQWVGGVAVSVADQTFDAKCKSALNPKSVSGVFMLTQLLMVSPNLPETQSVCVWGGGVC